MISLDTLEGKAQEIDESSVSTFSHDILWKLQMDKGFPYNIAILSPYTLSLQVHFVKGKGGVLCDKMYFDVNDPESYCEECTKPGYEGKGINFPVMVKCLIGYVFDLKDKKDKNKKGEEFTHYPLKIIEVQSGGRKKPNWERLDEAIAEEYLVFDPESEEPSVLRMKRREDKGMDVPYFLASRDLKKLPFELAVPEETLEEWGTKTKPEIYGTILSTYVGVQKEKFPGIVWPKTDEKPAEAEDNSVGGQLNLD